MSARGAALALCLAAAACSGVAPRTVTPSADGDYAAAIPDASTWRALCALAGNEVMAHVEVVKVLYDGSDQRLYFMQSRRWAIHFDFATRFLSTPGEPVLDHYQYNVREYGDAADRRFVNGTLTHYLDQDAWTFELFAGDKATIAQTADVFHRIAAATYFGAQLKYRPVPERQLAIMDQVRAALPVLATEELFANVRYEPLEAGEAWGTLRIVRAGAPLPELHPYDVAVLGTQPLELSPVAAIVTDELQAPLGHLAVLAHSRGTPNMALRGATTDPRLVALDGKPVRVRVGPNDWTIEAASPDDLARAGAKRRAKAPKLKLDVREAGLPALAQLVDDDVARFGSKTTQLARVARIGGVPTPRAFGLPFHAYAQFLAANGLDQRIAALLADRSLRADAGKLRAALDDLRARIAAAPVPAAITDGVLARVRALFPDSVHVRLRSSTNSEDLAEFSGAGLYRSARVDPHDRADVERGLREVWGSVWSWDAFAERDWYGIDHARVAMAILVQESIDDDAINGVAITGNPFFEGRPAVYINAQARGGSVTGAAGNEVPEQILFYTYETGRGIERISQSSLAKRPLLSDKEAMTFAHHLEKIHEEFTGESVGTARAVDVEFLVRASREIVIVQARPYRMRWPGDRKRVDD